jgi:hypothetical protein
VHWVFASQSGEVVVPTMLAKQMRVQRVYLVERQVGGLTDVAAEDRLFHLWTSDWLARQPGFTIELWIGHRCLLQIGVASASLATLVAAARSISSDSVNGVGASGAADYSMINAGLSGEG